MSALVAVAILPSLIVSYLAGRVVRQRAPAWGLVDRPGRRKRHAAPMPVGGGLAIWLGVVMTFAAGHAVLLLIGGGWLPTEALPAALRLHLAGLDHQAPRLWLLLGVATAMMLLGLADDRRGLSWQVRLAVQTVAAIALVAGWEGWRLTLFLDVPLVTGALSVLWIVALVNAFNMLDNMDGLAAGVAAIAATILALVMLTVPSGQPQLFVATFLLVLVGALLGFLVHNHHPARLFMGDAGSYLVGFLIAAATLMSTYSGRGLPRHAVLAPLCVLAIPLYDMASVIWIRLRHRRSPFEGDTNHFSHRLVDLGLSRRHAVWTIYLATATCGLGALVLNQVNLFGAIVVVLLVGCVLAIIAVLETAGRRRRHD